MKDITISNYHDVRVYHTLIGGTGKRRECERAAVVSLVHEAFGPDADLCHAPDGAPYIENSDCPVSVSHSSEAAVLAAGSPGLRLGIDLEGWRTQLHKVAPRVMSERELEYYTGEEGLLSAWTLKEAAYKCAGIRGLDFRKGIILPCGEGPIKIAPAGFEIDILTCGSFMGQWLALVSMSEP